METPKKCDLRYNLNIQIKMRIPKDADQRYELIRSVKMLRHACLLHRTKYELFTFIIIYLARCISICPLE